MGENRKNFETDSLKTKTTSRNRETFNPAVRNELKHEINNIKEMEALTNRFAKAFLMAHLDRGFYQFPDRSRSAV